MIGMVSSQKAATGRKLADAEPVRERGWSSPLAFPQPRPRQHSAADLARMIESEIIPRLMLAHASPEPEATEQAPAALDPEALDAFVAMTLSHEAPALIAYVRALLLNGVPLERVYVDLLGAAARRLGDDWMEDAVSFTDVTIALSRLHQVVRGLAVSFPTRGVEPAGHAACFVTAPGEQHAFGLSLVEDQFRRAGWRTWLNTAATREDAAQAVALDWFDVLGLSAMADAPVTEVASTIALVRKGSLNPRLFVLVGGRLFGDDPELVATVGADAYAPSASAALSVADKAVKRPAIA